MELHKTLDPEDASLLHAFFEHCKTLILSWELPSSTLECISNARWLPTAERFEIGLGLRRREGTTVLGRTAVVIGTVPEHPSVEDFQRLAHRLVEQQETARAHLHDPTAWRTDQEPLEGSEPHALIEDAPGTGRHVA